MSIRRKIVPEGDTPLKKGHLKTAFLRYFRNRSTEIMKFGIPHFVESESEHGI